MKRQIRVLSSMVLVTSMMFLIAIQSSSSIGEYDPWVDLNDDGAVDIFDAIALAGAFGSEGTPIQAKAGLEYDSGWTDIADACGQYFNITHNLNSTDLLVDISGKATADGGVHQRQLGGTGCTPAWSVDCGGTDNDYAYSVVQTSDEGYVVAGNTLSYGAGASDFWLVKFDSAQNLLWNRTYGGAGSDAARAVIQTWDGGYAMVGVTTSYGAGSGDVWLVKTSASGQVQWNKTYGGVGLDYGYSLVQTGYEYAIAGYTESFGAGGCDFWLVRTDMSGNLLWNKTYGGADDDYGYSLVQTSDYGYALTGYREVFGLPPHNDVWLVKTDSAGNMQWNETYGGGNDDRGYSVVQTSDGGYAVAGYTNSFGPRDFWLVKANSTGHLQWSRAYGGSSLEEAWSVVQTVDGGYALGGKAQSFGVGLLEFWLVKTDSSGNEQWSKTFGINGAYASCVIQTADQGYALAGAAIMGAGGYDFWLVKTKVENGLTWVDSTPDTITLYRGSTDPYWSYVRVRIWKIKDS